MDAPGVLRDEEPAGVVDADRVRSVVRFAEMQDDADSTLLTGIFVVPPGDVSTPYRAGVVTDSSAGGTTVPDGA